MESPWVPFPVTTTTKNLKISLSIEVIEILPFIPTMSFVSLRSYVALISHATSFASVDIFQEYRQVTYSVGCLLT